MIREHPAQVQPETRSVGASRDARIIGCDHERERCDGHPDDRGRVLNRRQSNEGEGYHWLGLVQPNGSRLSCGALNKE